MARPGKPKDPKVQMRNLAKQRAEPIEDRVHLLEEVIATYTAELELQERRIDSILHALNKAGVNVRMLKNGKNW